MIDDDDPGLDVVISVFKPVKDKIKKVIIVGNSPDVFNNKFGSFIDTFDIVIRLNRCPTDGFEKYIGSKTDIWATSSWCLEPAPDGLISDLSDHYPYWIPNDFNKITAIWYRTPVTQKDFKRMYTKLWRVCNRENDYVMYKTPEFKEFFKNYTTLAPEKGRHTNIEPVMKESKADWCTGMLAILTATLFYEDVTIYGFSFYNESAGAVTAYYRESECDEFGKHPEDIAWARAKQGYDTDFISDLATKERFKIINDLQEKGLIKILK